MRWWIAACCAAVSLGGGLWITLASSDDSAEPATRTIPAADPGPAPSRAGGIARRNVETRARRDETPEGPDVPSPGAAQPPTPPVRPELGPALATRFDAETEDRGWSSEAEHEVDRALAPLLDRDSFIDEVSCRSTLCMVEVSHRSVSAFASFPETIPMAAPFDQEVFIAEDETDPTGHTVYVARQGHRLAPDRED